ncbi:hypothetical protein BZA05DRAFT_319814, partial [Tricharina praecox]|uniref:uncharacterized protein n=1 Tax=Tricharina praecox TaxID=43433 RepID=UPI00221E928A
FGERFAQQFMSVSTSWVDSLIFSMAPLGVITAIVGAIRVGGPSWLRGIIGRARETRAAAEVELMSSTSHEVCEIWNGDAIVRVMGSPQIQQLLYFENVPDNLLEKIKKRRSAEGSTSTRSCYSGCPSAAESGTSKYDAPNISMNLSVLKKPWELYLAAAVGVLSQAAVIVVATYAAYTPHLQFNKTGLTVQKYSYPLTSIGTLLLVTGMFIAASVVERSTHEDTYEKRSEMRITWAIQRGRVINDQTFDSYAIIADGPVDTVRTSSRQPSHKDSDSHASPLMRGFTVLGTVTSVVGFIFQFIGLRGMHWSASTAQLGATILMTIVRALLRRGMAKRPSSVKL